jgi:hypothetical protein
MYDSLVTGCDASQGCRAGQEHCHWQCRIRQATNQDSHESPPCTWTVLHRFSAVENFKESRQPAKTRPELVGRRVGRDISKVR